MKQSLILLSTLSIVVSASAFAQADLAKAKNCMACHAVASKLVGPAYKDVAAKYTGQKNSEGELAHKIMKGSAGVWGPVPMPPNPQVSEAEARTLAKWVLSQK